MWSGVFCVFYVHSMHFGTKPTSCLRLLSKLCAKHACEAFWKCTVGLHLPNDKIALEIPVLHYMKIRVFVLNDVKLNTVG